MTPYALYFCVQEMDKCHQRHMYATIERKYRTTIRVRRTIALSYGVLRSERNIGSATNLTRELALI